MEEDESHASMTSNEEASCSNSDVPRLIDEKRKHLQRKLSASQQDEILIGEARGKLIPKRNGGFLKDFNGILCWRTEQHQPVYGANQHIVQPFFRSFGTVSSPTSSNPSTLPSSDIWRILSKK